MPKLIYIALIGIGFISLGYSTWLISRLVKELKPSGRHKVWSLLRVFTILFMVSFVAGIYVIWIDDQGATNILLSSVFFCGGIFVSIAMISVRTQTAELKQTKESDFEKETLLKEIHHRVKNNLQIIISMLRLEKGKLTDEQAIESLTSCENKVHTMATIHEKLYQAKDLSNVNFGDYAEEIIQNITLAFGNKRIEKELNVCEANLSLDLLIPLGLVLNEIVSNSIKHGFKGRSEGKLHVHLIDEHEGSYKLTIYDNGPGIPVNFFESSDSGLGAELIEALISQINGSVNIVPFAGSNAFEIKFEKGN